MRYRRGDSTLIVTKPNGDVVQRDMVLYFDTQLSIFGIALKGDGPLKGYNFEIVQGELKRIRDGGTETEAIPRSV